MTRTEICVDLAQCFNSKTAAMPLVQASDFTRRFCRNEQMESEILIDEFTEYAAACCFIRIPTSNVQFILLTIDGDYQLKSISAGGWLLTSDESQRSLYWIPCTPVLRLLDVDKHIIKEISPTILGFNVTSTHLSVEIAAPKNDLVLDLTVWRFSPEAVNWQSELDCLVSLEIQPYFIYGSHSTYNRPADVYAHLIHGHVYDTQFIWPRYWKIADELDAYALYLVLSGLEFSTDKRLYGLLKQHVLYSVIARQREDGGWYHGEWTDQMECHVRLHCGGMHLLATALEEQGNPVVAEAFYKSAVFVAKLTDETAIGAWFLHDTLEQSREAMDRGPFPWQASRVLGKSETNMFVLNTHLDTLIALDRYRRLTGNMQFDDLIVSGQHAATAILAHRPAEVLYQVLYWLIDLTLLPVEIARRLPLPLRVLKRFTWKYLIPRIHYVRTQWPRLVMSNGFIDRALSLQGVSHAYQSVNIWDLIRYRRRFPDQSVAGDVIDKALQYTQETPLRSFWIENKKKGHALGFWTDALWHLCITDPESDYRRWLAEAMIACEDAGWGIPPALLGANTEAVPVEERATVGLISLDHRLRIANLSRLGKIEVLIANPDKGDIPLCWQDDQHLELLQWQSSSGDVYTYADPLMVPARGWLRGYQG